MRLLHLTKANNAFILLLVLVKLNNAVSSEVLEKVDENGSKWIFYDKPIVLKITDGIFQGNKTYASNETLSKFFLESHVTSNFYYQLNENATSKIFTEVFRRAEDYHELYGISFMLCGNASMQDVIDLKNNSASMNGGVDLALSKKSVVDSAVFLFEMKTTCDCLLATHIISYQVKKAKNASMKTGVEYGQRFIECCDQSKNEFIGLVDQAILRIELSPLTTMLSYGTFSQLMTKLVAENQKFVRKRNTMCVLYVHPVIGNWDNTISLAKYKRYEALLSEYYKMWRENNAGEETNFISHPMPQITIFDNGEFLKENVTLRIIGFGDFIYEQKAAPLQLLACEPQQVIKLMLPAVNNILFDNPTLSFLQRILATCEYDNLTIANSLKMHKTNAIMLLASMGDPDLTEISHREVFNLLSQQKGKTLTDLNVRKIYFDTDLEPENIIRTDTKRVLNLLKANNIQVGCYVNSREFERNLDLRDFPKFLEGLDHACNFLPRKPNVILLAFVLVIDDKKQLLEVLKHFQEAKEIFEETRPGRQLIPTFLMVLMSFDDTGENILSSESPYCDTSLKLLNEYYQTIISFANIHQWPGLHIVKDLDRGHGLWEDARTDASIDRSLTSFPVLWRSNSQTSNGKNLPMTFPCIEWTQDANSTGIDFLKNQLLGSTFPIKLKKSSPLSAEEMEMALYVVLGRFSFVELITADVTDLRLAGEIFSTNFLKHLSDVIEIHSNGPLVYVEVPLIEAQNLQKMFNGAKNNDLVAVHITGWELLLQEKLNQTRPVLSYQHNFSHRFGITVQNCSHEMNLGLDRLKSLPLIKNVSYIVCNVPPVLPSNIERQQMEQYFETLFYTKSYMERHLPLLTGTTTGIEVLFRINVISGERQCPVTREKAQSSFLRFLDDVSQHSAAYKIRYFIVRAFQPEESAEQCPYTWWHLRNYSDLTNVSDYVDTEEEYFDRPTKIRIPPKFKNEASLSSNTELYWIVLVLVAITAITASAVLWLWIKRFPRRLLNAKEIDQFHNGMGELTEVVNNEIEMISTDFLSKHMKFPDTYEVPFRDVKIGEVIGSGHFGLVQKGMIISQQLEVAIKIPLLDSGKDQFLNTLTELKILCYVGGHPNIVLFLGACTKKIAIGKLYILTEFCENGSLEGYLRRLQSEQNDRSQKVDLCLLYRFAQQIASGMEHLADKKVVHGDLASRNVLLTGDYICKIGDFGLSRRLYELREIKKASTELIPWRWMALESLNNREFTLKSDVWSYGVTLWEIFSLGKIPYPEETWTADFVRKLENGERMEKAQYASADIHNKTLACCNRNPEERPTFAVLQQYFAQLRSIEYVN